MQHHIVSSAVIGIGAEPVTVEADIAFGMPAFNIVGLPDTSVKEARDRIRAAIRHAGFTFPRTRVTVNLAPAHVKKQGGLYDLPIALAILLADGLFPREAVRGTLAVGELSLDGSVRPVSGVLPTAVMAKRSGFDTLFVPASNAREASCVSGINAYPVRHLAELVGHFQGTDPLLPAVAEPLTCIPGGEADFADIRGQEFAKRGLEIAAGGGHNVLLKGPPGTGKTLLARALPSILPPLTHEESLETTSIASVAGLLRPEEGLMAERPFRTPHHSSSAVSLVGGGAWPRPGEVTLAHRGILFLDELPEFSRHVLEHLRQPLEDGSVTIARAAASVQFPARFILAAAMNPCPCGFASDPTRACICTPRSLSMYQKRISGRFSTVSTYSSRSRTSRRASFWTRVAGKRLNPSERGSRPHAPGRPTVWKGRPTGRTARFPMPGWTPCARSMGTDSPCFARR